MMPFRADRSHHPKGGLAIHVTWEEFRTLASCRVQHEKSDSSGSLNWDERPDVMESIFDRETIATVRRHKASGGALPELIPHACPPGTHPQRIQ